MDFFNDLNPYLVRQDGDTEEASLSFAEPTEVKVSKSSFTEPTEEVREAKEPEAVRTPIPPITRQPMMDQTYVENILRLNIGKSGTFYFSYGSSKDWRDRSYKGVIEQVGSDHFVIRDPKTKKRHLVQFVYLDWAEFDDAINYKK